MKMLMSEEIQIIITEIMETVYWFDDKFVYSYCRYLYFDMFRKKKEYLSWTSWDSLELYPYYHDSSQ
jgi:hypothetical protein